MEAIENKKFVIIAGAERSGTTSLFSYLGEHPKICPASSKETRFFMDRGYPIGVRYYHDEGIEKYLNYFTHCASTPIYLEASPQYLYSTGTPERIRSTLKNVRLIFILRDPIERLKSLYLISIRLGRIPTETTFKKWIQPQLTRSKGGLLAIEHHMHALEQGRYSKYLAKYLDEFPRGEIAVYQFGQLKNSPSELIRDICEFIGVSGESFINYDFRVHNKSTLPRFPTLNFITTSTRDLMKKKIPKENFIYRNFRASYRRILPAYMRFLMREAEDFTLPADLLEELQEYYQDEEGRLGRLLEVPKLHWIK